MRLPYLSETDAWLLEVWRWLRSRLARGAQMQLFEWRASAEGLTDEQRLEAWHRLMLLEDYVAARRRVDRLQARKFEGYVVRALEDMIDA